MAMITHPFHYTAVEVSARMKNYVSLFYVEISTYSYSYPGYQLIWSIARIVIDTV